MLCSLHKTTKNFMQNKPKSGLQTKSTHLPIVLFSVNWHFLCE